MLGAVVTVILLCFPVFAFFGGWVANQKGRDPFEGGMLGLLFGPFGVHIEALLPTDQDELATRKDRLRAADEAARMAQAKALARARAEEGRYAAEAQAREEELRERRFERLREKWRREVGASEDDETPTDEELLRRERSKVNFIILVVAIAAVALVGSIVAFSRLAGR